MLFRSLRAEEQESDDEGNSNDDKSFDLLTKNFNKFLQKMSRRKSTQNSTRINNFQKNKKVVSTGELKKQNKGIQCREYEGFGHIQSECANTLKKKGKSFKTTWSDEESEGSEEEDDHVSNYIAFQVTSKKDVSASVTTDAAT